MPTKAYDTVIKTKSETPPLNPTLVLACGVFFASISSILIRLVQNNEVPSLVIAALRLTFATIILIPLALTRRRDELSKIDRTILIPAILSGIFLAIHFATWITAINYTTVATSNVLVSTSPIWVALASPFFLNEKVPRTVQIGILIALVGAIIVSITDFLNPTAQVANPQPLLGSGLALIGAVTAAAYFLLGRKLRTTLSLLSYITLVYGAAAITLLIFAAVAGHNLFIWKPLDYAIILGMTLGPQLLGHSSFNYAVGYLPAAIVSVTLIAEPIGASILALIIFSEIPTLFTILGGMLILAGILIASRTNSNE